MATGGLFGQVGQFDKGKENFTAYLERFDMFIEANGIVAAAGAGGDATRARIKAIFLTEIGAEVYNVLTNLVAPEKPRDKTFDQIKEVLKKHYDPKPLEIAESFRYWTTNQTGNQSIAQYIVHLKKLSLHCNFGTFLQRALRDKFVCGLSSERIQTKLLNTDELDFDKACKIALSMEMAGRDIQDIKISAPPIAQVSKVSATGNTSNSGSRAASASNNNYSKQKGRNSIKCSRCAGRHPSEKCPNKDATCYKCQLIGHFAVCCKTKIKDGQIRLCEQAENELLPDDDEDDDWLGIYGIADVAAIGKNNGYCVDVLIGDTPIKMQVDTAADYSVLPLRMYKELFADKYKICKTDVRLNSYTDNPLCVIGEFYCYVKCNGQEHTLRLVVVDHNKPPLFGKNWLQVIRLNWDEIFSVNSAQASDKLHYSANQRLDLLLRKNSRLFQEGYEGMTGFKAHIRMDDNAKPIFLKARSVPYALREAVEVELEKLEKNGVIKKVERSEWASPVVIVPKKDKTVRICGDYKVSINKFVEDEQYNMPTTQDLFVELGGSKVFSKLDLSHAYAQLSVEETSQKYLTINTHKGLYSYTKLPYGVKSAPKIFQRNMDIILQGVPKCVCKQDDVLIGGDTDDENIEILTEVFDRLSKHNVHLNLSKCDFLKPSVVYLGFELSADGRRPVEAKTEAIRNAPPPANVSQLRSFLGMVQYYHSFLDDLATKLEPLHQLLKKGVRWKWTKECQEAFELVKGRLCSDQVLVHYDPNREVRLACDASSYGLGGVLSHVMDDGSERPIAYASRTMNSAERNYPQVEREALSLIFGVKKFHQYIYGRKFTLMTDHESLQTILGPKSGIPTLAALRMQHWALTLSAYDYDVVYRSNENHGNSDYFSRCPLAESKNNGSSGKIYSLEVIGDDFPLVAEEIAKETKVHPILSKVHDLVMRGWPSDCDSEHLKPYFNRRNELSCEQGCVLWGSRVIIPQKLRDRVLDELHWEHPGICSMKAIARSYVWWPKLDADIEERVKSCGVCQSVRQNPSKVPLFPWKWCIRPFQRIHIDFCEENNKDYLILLDSYSKWVDVKYMGNSVGSTTADRTIDELRLIFAEHGLPEECVSDNGPQFTSEKFKLFLQKNGIKQTLVAPYHAASNGAAERAVRVVKEAFTKQVIEGNKSRSIKHRIADFLLRYRTTPHSSTGVTPAELMTKRQFRTRLTLLKPDLAKQSEKIQLRQKKQFDKGRKVERFLSCGDIVRVRNTLAKSKSDKWVSGEVIEVKGPRNYMVKIGERTRLVHVDHMVLARDLDSSEQRSASGNGDM